jgi:serine/threonine-protein kinase RIO1
LSKKDLGSRLSGATFVRGMLAAAEQAEVLAQFGGHGVIRDVVKIRAFRGGRTYAGDRSPVRARARRAMHDKSDAGRLIAHHEWVTWEWETLCRLHEAGADVPAPIASSEDAILMQFVGEGAEPAPQLRQVHVDRETARHALDRLLRDVANREHYFARYGLSCGDFAERAWERYQCGQLGR